MPKSMFSVLLVLSFLALLGAVELPAQTVQSGQSTRPNLVLIMCDDLGYSDLGCYGGEIETPHIDRLAETGIRFSQFRNTGRCAPSRAALLTGRHQHAVDMGWMAVVDEHRPGYRGQLSIDVPTIAELLKNEGYGTYMVGKWHLTVTGNFENKKRPKPNGSWPRERGFDETYSVLWGAKDYFKPKYLLRNETPIHQFPQDYYFTHAVTEHAVNFIQQHDAEKPLFLYIAHYAPHRPLQAPKKRIEKCLARYRAGNDALRQARYQRLLHRGLLKADLPLPLHHKEFNGQRPSWHQLSDQQKSAWVEHMATYAAMVEIVDDGVGAVVEALKTKGMYDNSVIFFLSDNGATRVGNSSAQLAGDLSNTPFRHYKSSTFYGGTGSPLVVHAPSLLSEKNQVSHEPAHITDLAPTCLDLAGVLQPGTFQGKTLPNPPFDGISLVPAFQKKALPARDFFFEHQTSCAVISGHWKLVRSSFRSPWELIDLKADPFEQNDLAEKYPERVSQLETRWTQWAKANQVLPLESLDWDPRIKYYRELYPDQSGLANP